MVCERVPPNVKVVDGEKSGVLDAEVGEVDWRDRDGGSGSHWGDAFKSKGADDAGFGLGHAEGPSSCVVANTDVSNAMRSACTAAEIESPLPSASGRNSHVSMADL